MFRKMKEEIARVLLRTRMAETDVAIKLHLAELYKECGKQMAEYEHEFHSKKEEKGIELARIDAEIEAKKELLADKDKQIAYLKDIIGSITGCTPR